MDLLGINRRNRLIAQVNPREAIALANDKLRAKKALKAAGLAVPKTLVAFGGLSDIAIFDFSELPDCFVIKPNGGSKGLGIALAQRSGSTCWQVGGQQWDERRMRRHLQRIFSGEFTLSGAHRDTAFIEELVQPHAAFARLGDDGLCDIRVICFEAHPIQAMLRLPTGQSGGKANLHRGALGLGLAMPTGRCNRAWFDEESVTHHPETGRRLTGFEVPLWKEVLNSAQESAAALGLGYAGADLVVTEDGEVLVLEVNAFPGIEIQNVNEIGLRSQIDI